MVSGSVLCTACQMCLGGIQKYARSYQSGLRQHFFHFDLNVTYFWVAANWQNLPGVVQHGEILNAK